MGISAVGLQALAAGPGRYRDLARLADSLGYGSFWVPETSGAEAFTMLGCLSAATESIGLGTGIIPMKLRPPTVAAMGAATLAGLSPRRDIHLGIGLSSPVIVAGWHGVDYGKDLPAQAREYLTVVRAVLADGRCSYDGDHYRVRGYRLGVPLPPRRPRLVLAAMNPAMLRLAGELADAVLLAYPLREELPAAIAWVREGEAAASRAEGSCQVAAYVRVHLGSLPGHLPVLRRELIGYALAPGYARRFERTAYAAELRAVRGYWREGDRQKALEAISAGFVSALTLAGEPAQLRGELAALAGQGIDQLVLVPLGLPPDPWASVVATVTALAPAGAPPPRSGAGSGIPS